MTTPKHRIWLASALLVWLASACVTPSVPIPPPSPEKMAFEVDPTDGTARFLYAADPSYGGAIVYVFNRDVGEGIITTAREDGSVGPTDPFPAREGDDLIITFELDDQVTSVCIEVRDGPSSSALECNVTS